MKTTSEKAQELHDKQSALSQLREIMLSDDWNAFNLHRKLQIVAQIEAIIGPFTGTKAFRQKIDEYLAK